MNQYTKTIIISIIVYLFGVFTGYSTFDNDTSVKTLTKHTTFNTWDYTNKEALLLRIIKNNSTVVTINISGIFTLSVVSICTTFYNGYIFGRLIIFTFRNFGFKAIVSHILPHSIEIIAIILSCSISISASIDITRHICTKELISKKQINFYGQQLLICFAIVILTATVETYISIY